MGLKKKINLFSKKKKKKVLVQKRKNDDEICIQEETDRFETEGLIARLNAAENHWSVATPPEVKFEGKKKGKYKKKVFFIMIQLHNNKTKIRVHKPGEIIYCHSLLKTDLCYTPALLRFFSSFLIEKKQIKFLIWRMSIE